MPNCNLYGPGGNTGVQMGGWWRKEIKGLTDLDGVKMRIAGICRAGDGQARRGAAADPAATSIRRWSAAPSTRPNGSVPMTTKLGFFKVAPYYYYPGFWEGGPAIHSSPTCRNGMTCRRATRRVLTTAAAYANADMLGQVRRAQSAALRRLVAGGAQLRAFRRT